MPDINIKVASGTERNWTQLTGKNMLKALVEILIFNFVSDPTVTITEQTELS